jgi:hypothetical protein
MVVQQLGLPSPYDGMSDQELAARLQAEEDQSNRNMGGMQAMIQAMMGGAGGGQGQAGAFGNGLRQAGGGQWTEQRYNGQMDRGMQLLRRQAAMGGAGGRQMARMS